MSLVGRKAPVFSAAAVINGNEIVENFSLDQYLGKKDVIFYFYPKDFTFVCPTEILSFQEKLKEFEKRNVAVVGCSTDTENSHLAWLFTPKKQGGIEGVKYPLVADVSKTIAVNFGVLGGDFDYNEEGMMTFHGSPIAYRATFLIDKKGIVRHQLVNDLPLGRDINETLRIVDALQYHEAHGEVCPANWEEGKATMKETRESVAEYLTNN